MEKHQAHLFQSSMAALAEVYGKELSPALIELYWNALQAVPIMEFQKAAAKWIETEKHFPKPAELSEKYRQGVLATRATTETDVERLCAHLTKTHWTRMTPKQQRGPWEYLRREGRLVGVKVFEDETSPAITMYLEDLPAR